MRTLPAVLLALGVAGCDPEPFEPPVFSDTGPHPPSSAACDGEASTTAATEGDAPAVRINELMWWDQGPYDWIELVNVGGAPAELAGWWLNDDDERNDEALVLGSTITIEPGAFLVLHRHNSGQQGVREYEFGLTWRDELYLYDDQGTLVDSHSWEMLRDDQVVGRHPDGAGEQSYLPCSTQGAVNHAPTAQADCEASWGCETLGMCTLWEGRCWKQADGAEQCSEPVGDHDESVCQAHAHCSIDERGLCMALSTDDCDEGYGSRCDSRDWDCWVVEGECRAEYDPQDDPD